MRLAMTMMIRDAADVVEANLRYHHAQGVDLFVIADSGSTDGTLEILEPYEEAGLVKLERIPGQLGAMWSTGRTKIARRAFELGADWVIHNDEDEFWWPLTGNLKEALGAIPERFGMVVAPRTEFVARPGEGFFADRMTAREARCLRPPKAAHRAHPRVVLGQPQPTQIWLEDGQADDVVAPPALHESGADHSAQANLELVLAPTFPIRVLSFPLRSFAQLGRLGELNATLVLLDGEQHEKARAAYEAGRLEEVYDELVLADEQVERGIAEGWLVEDTDFRDYLAACADSLAGVAAPDGSRDWPAERRERELAALELDGMYALTHYVRGTGVGNRGRYEVLEQTEFRLRRRLRRDQRRLHQQDRRLQRREVRLQDIKSSRWWRLRPRLPKRLRRRNSPRGAKDDVSRNA
jgi:Glycosyl transferase family 2